MPILADLIVRLTGDTQSATQALAAADQAIQRTTTQGGANLSSLSTIISRLGNEALPGLGSNAMLASRALDDMGRTGASAAQQLGVLAAGAGLFGTAIAGISFEAFDRGITTLHQFAIETGLTEQQISGLQTAISASGGNATRAAQEFAQFQRQLEMMQQGLDAGTPLANNFTKALGDLGIKAYDLDGQVRPMATLLPEIMDKFQAGAAAAQASGQHWNAAGLAVELFGRAGYQLLPVLEAGSAGLNHFTEQAAAMGIASETEMRRWGEWRVTSAQLQQAFQGAGMALGSELAPAATSIAGVVESAAEAFARLPGPLQSVVAVLPLATAGAALLGATLARGVEFLAPTVNILTGYAAAQRTAATATVAAAAAEEGAIAAAAALGTAEREVAQALEKAGLAASSQAPEWIALGTAQEAAAAQAAALAAEESHAAAAGAEAAIAGGGFAAMAGPLGAIVTVAGLAVGGFLALKSILDQEGDSQRSAADATNVHTNAIQQQVDALRQEGASDAIVIQMLRDKASAQQAVINGDLQQVDALRAQLREQNQAIVRVAPGTVAGGTREGVVEYNRLAQAIGETRAALKEAEDQQLSDTKVIQDYLTQLEKATAQQHALADAHREVAAQALADAQAIGGQTVATAAHADALDRLKSLTDSANQSAEARTVLDAELADAERLTAQGGDALAAATQKVADIQKQDADPSTKAWAKSMADLLGVLKTLTPAEADAAIAAERSALAQKEAGEKTSERAARVAASAGLLASEGLAAENAARAHQQLESSVQRESQTLQGRTAAEGALADAIQISNATFIERAIRITALNDLLQNGDATQKAYAQTVQAMVESIAAEGQAATEAATHSAELAGQWQEATANGGNFRDELATIQRELQGTAKDAQTAKEQILGIFSTPTKDEQGFQTRISQNQAAISSLRAGLTGSSAADQEIARLEEQRLHLIETGAKASDVAKVQADLNRQLAAVPEAEGQAALGAADHIHALDLENTSLKAQKQALTDSRTALHDQAAEQTSAAGTLQQYRDLWTSASPVIVDAVKSASSPLIDMATQLQTIIDKAHGATGALAGIGSSTAGTAQGAIGGAVTTTGAGDVVPAVPAGGATGAAYTAAPAVTGAFPVGGARTLSIQEMAQGLAAAGMPAADIPTMVAILLAESGGSTTSGSAAGAYGFGQLMPGFGGISPSARTGQTAEDFAAQFAAIVRGFSQPGWGGPGFTPWDPYSYRGGGNPNVNYGEVYVGAGQGSFQQFMAQVQAALGGGGAAASATATAQTAPGAPGAPGGLNTTTPQNPLPAPESGALTDEERQRGLAEATRRASDAQRELNSIQGKGHDEFATITRDQIAGLDAERDRLKGIAEQDYGRLRDADSQLADDYANNRDDMVKADKDLATAAENDAKDAGTAYQDAAKKADDAWTAFLGHLTRQAADARAAADALRDAQQQVASFYGGEPSAAEMGTVTAEQLAADQEKLNKARADGAPALARLTQADRDYAAALQARKNLPADATDAAKKAAEEEVELRRGLAKAAADEYEPLKQAAADANATVIRDRQARSAQEQELNRLDVDKAADAARLKIADEGSLTAAQNEAVNSRIDQMKREGASAERIAAETSNMRRNFIEGNKAAGNQEVSTLQAQGDAELAHYKATMLEKARLQTALTQQQAALAAADPTDTAKIAAINAEIAALQAALDADNTLTEQEKKNIQDIIDLLNKQKTATDNVTSSEQAAAAAAQRTAQQQQQAASSGGGGGGQGTLTAGTYGFANQNQSVLQYEVQGLSGPGTPGGGQSGGPTTFSGKVNMFNYSDPANSIAALLYAQATQNQGPNENTTVVVIDGEVIARLVDRYWGRRHTTTVVGRN